MTTEKTTTKTETYKNTTISFLKIITKLIGLVLTELLLLVGLSIFYIVGLICLFLGAIISVIGCVGALGTCFTLLTPFASLMINIYYGIIMVVGFGLIHWGIDSFKAGAKHYNHFRTGCFNLINKIAI